MYKEFRNHLLQIFWHNIGIKFNDVEEQVLKSAYDPCVDRTKKNDYIIKANENEEERDA